MINPRRVERLWKRQSKKLISIGAVFSVLICLWEAPGMSASTVSYTYDDAGRLMAVDYSNSKFIDYRYDSAGNLLSRTGGTALSGNVFPDTSVGLEDAILALQTANRIHAQGISTRGDVNADRCIGVAEAIYVLQVLAEIRIGEL